MVRSKPSVLKEVGRHIRELVVSIILETSPSSSHKRAKWYIWIGLIGVFTVARSVHVPKGGQTRST